MHLQHSAFIQKKNVLWMLGSHNLKRLKYPHVFMILYGSLPIDTRVEREIDVLVSKKYRITIVDTDLGYGEWPSREGVMRVPIMKIPLSKRQSISGLL